MISLEGENVAAHFSDAEQVIVKALSDGTETLTKAKSSLEETTAKCQKMLEDTYQKVAKMIDDREAQHKEEVKKQAESLERAMKKLSDFKASSTKGLEEKYKAALDNLGQIDQKQINLLQDLVNRYSIPTTTCATQTDSQLTDQDQSPLAVQFQSLFHDSQNDLTLPPSKRRRTQETQHALQASFDSQPNVTVLTGIEREVWDGSSVESPSDIKCSTSEIIALAKAITKALNLTSLSQLSAAQIMKLAAALIKEADKKEIISAAKPTKNKSRTYNTPEIQRQINQRAQRALEQANQKAFQALRAAIGEHIETYRLKETVPKTVKELLEKALSILTTQNSTAKYLSLRSVTEPASLTEFLRNAKQFK